jgi:hypothetical protein
MRARRPRRPALASLLRRHGLPELSKQFESLKYFFIPLKFSDLENFFHSLIQKFHTL